MSQPPNNQFPGQQPPYGEPGQQPPYGEPGQQPPYGQQGQPPYGQPGNPGQPYDQGAFPPPGVEPKKKAGVGTIVRVGIAVVVLAIGGFFAWQRFATEAALKPGNCIVLSGDRSDDVDPKQVNCDDDKQFSWYVTETFDSKQSCGDAVPLTSEYTSRRGGSKTTKTTCLVENFIVDKCYNQVSTGNSGYELADCGGAHFKVTALKEGATASCDAPSEAYPQTKPGRTYCVELLG